VRYAFIELKQEIGALNHCFQFIIVHPPNPGMLPT